MKKLLLCAVSLFTAIYSNGQCGQKAITLTDDNVQLQSGKIHEHSASIKKVKLPSTGSNASWDYSGLSGGAAITYGYLDNNGKNKNTAFSKTAVLDTGINEHFDPAEEDGYPTTNVYDEDSKGLFFAGLITPKFPRWLGPGFNTNDSAVIQKQVSTPSSRVDVIKFPATSNSKWSSTSTLKTNFYVNVAELGWEHVTAYEVEYTTVNDAVVGWGDLKIPTTKNQDKHNEFDALMVKHSIYTFDSIFVYPFASDPTLEAYFGAPDGTDDGIPYSGITNVKWTGWPLGYPTSQHQVDQYAKLKGYGTDFVNALIGTFGTALDPYGLLASNGTSQGMVTVNDNSEIFYAEDAFRPAITFDFGTDNTYSNLVSIVYNMDKVGDGDDESVQLTGTKFGTAGSNAPQLNGGNGQSMGMQSDYSASAQVSIYPNPLVNSSALNCSMVKNSDATWTISIMNMTGQIIETIPVSAKGILNIPISPNENMKSGLYIVNISDETGKRVGLSKVNVFSAAN